jgi:hypothetical protein
MSADNMRRCCYCTSKIVTECLTGNLDYLDYCAAWLAGFCSPVCQREGARLKVTAGTAWWQNGKRITT